jgi:hypothetical protein
LWPGKAGQRLRPEIGEIEQPADLRRVASAMTSVFGAAAADYLYARVSCRNSLTPRTARSRRSCSPWA